MGQQDLRIHKLVAEIERGDIRLPEMPRSYVWQQTRVRDLPDSPYRAYPSRLYSFLAHSEFSFGQGT